MKLIYKQLAGDNVNFGHRADGVTHINAGDEVRIGDVVLDFRGDKVEVTGARKPHKPSSSGHVQTTEGEYYVSVIGAEWIDRTDR